jgi:DNA mismatch endonuclease (patch repair protein)
MTDNLSAQNRVKTMRAVKSKGTRLEKHIFAMLAGMGLKGWRKNADDVVGKPDIVFRELQVAIFIDGCFWHGCPHCRRPMPQANREYWERKIARNVHRDAVNRNTLVKGGWIVISIWEHEIRDPAKMKLVKQQVRAAVQCNNAVRQEETA